ncbi:hypothetical protein [Pantoea sp. Cy-639]|uniref:hypothetical protein n=1 Tax=Pantoea sp. Cy-639 TaxID=2608360 RepID=UPI001421DF6F|nr:hypothetical protein [Pantoea sp. Cy-639]NIF18210.1 hypothetical protein [Pantoea sp. Cy-639]
MSVLNFPRIYLNGHMYWNPPTGNNNDMYPLYDAVRAEMNWRFLKYYNITPENAASTLMPWTIAPRVLHEAPDYVTQVPGNVGQNPPIMIPGEWDLFGDNACGTVDYKQTRSLVLGGELPGGGYVDSDALIGQPFNLFGNPFASPNPTPARFVDVSPWQNTFTALYFDRMVLGNDECGLVLQREFRMLDRFLNFNWAGSLGGLIYVTTTWQTCFPRENLTWTVGDSVLLRNLQQQMLQQNAKGLMFRFSTFMTCYDKNGVFNDYPPMNTRSTTPLAMAAIQDIYQRGLEDTTQIVFNPAYSRTAGTLGLWFDDEYPTAPAGRRLVPTENKMPLQRPGAQPSSATLGVLSAEVHGNTLSLDLGNTFPSYPVDKAAAIPAPEKYDAGTYQLGVRNGNQFTPVVSFGYSDYQQSAFRLRSGILDLPLSAEAQKTLASGPLELQRVADSPLLASTQQMWTAEVVESGSFVDVGASKTLQIMVQCDGKPAPAGTVVTVAEYGNAYMMCTTDYYLAFSNQPEFTLFIDYPENRKNNTANLPQFVGTAALTRQVTEGTGRQLTAIRDVETIGDGVEVSYQEYLPSPGAVALRPCLAFEQPIQCEGTLEKPTSTVHYSTTRITTDANGIARLTVRGVAPGFPTLRFFLPDESVPFSFQLGEAYVDFLAPLRVLPLEPQLQKDFVDTWNRVYQDQDASTQIWESFIYPRILQPYFYLYPIMNKYMPLNSLSRVEGAIDQLIVLISKDYQEESTLAMPITRDMPQSRRAVLELWANALVKRNYPPCELSMDDYNQA